MSRSSLVIVAIAVLCTASPCAAAPSPTPKTAASAKPKRVPGFAARVHVPTTTTTRVTAADCSSRGAAVVPPNNALGPNGASPSQTLVSVPISGSSVSSVTHNAQIADVCRRQ
jgi:hypothetical protein